MNKPLIAALALSLPIGGALAQNAADRKERIEQFNQRFNEADANGDGKLTREEAKDKMPGIYTHFDVMDVEKKGYLTKQDIAKAMRKMGAARKAASQSQT